MSTTETQAAEAVSNDFTQTWRYKVGLFMIVVGNLGIVVALVLPIFGVPAAVIGALVVGGEVVSLGSIVFLGKEGFKAIKSKIFGAVKAAYAGPVSRTRHRIGITLLCANIVTTYTMMLYAWDAFAAATAKGPTAAVWGLDVAQQGDLVFWLFLIGELSVLIAIYVLGADWWGKFRKLFVWEAPEKQG